MNIKNNKSKFSFKPRIIIFIRNMKITIKTNKNKIDKIKLINIKIKNIIY